MKITNHSNAVVSTSSARTETQAFGIGDSAKIIHILRNSLYARPIQTCVQEYLCNGRDAMRESKNPDRPIMVYLPTKIDLRIRFRDFGPGLSEERIRDIFTQYGKSTKDKSDSETGGFGLGAKSAWAYTDSFYIVSYLNGKAYPYVAHTGDRHEGSLDPLSVDDTNEENGTEIQIALKSDSDIREFTNAVFRATLFWKTRPIIKGISDKEIPHYYTNFSGSQIIGGDNWNVYRSQTLGSIFPHKDNQNLGIVIAIDNIPYVLEKLCLTESTQKLSTMLKDGTVLVIAVKNGKVDVNASRESMSSNAESKLNLEAAGEEICTLICDMLRSEIESQTTVKAFVRKYQKLSDSLTVGKILPEVSIKFPGRSYSIVTRSLDHRNRNAGGDVSFEANFNGVQTYTVEKAFFKNGNLKRLYTEDTQKHRELDFINSPVCFLDINSITKINARKKLSTFLIDSHNATEQNPGICFSFAGIGEALPYDEAVKNMFLALQEDFGAIALSEVIAPEAERVHVQRHSTAGLWCLHMVSAHGEFQGALGISIESSYKEPEVVIESAQKYYYMDMLQGKPDFPYIRGNCSFNDLVRYIKANGGLVCAVNSRIKEKIKDLPQFIELSVWISDFQATNKFTDLETTFLKTHSFPELSEFFQLLASRPSLLEGLKDPRILAFYKSYKANKELLKATIAKRGINLNYALPLAKISPIASDMAATVEEVNGKMSAISDAYPIANIVARDSYNSYYRATGSKEQYFQKMAVEIEFYINGKYEMSQKQLK